MGGAGVGVQKGVGSANGDFYREWTCEVLWLATVCT
jgi:hypothetical protein